MTTSTRPGLDPAALTVRLTGARPPRLLDVRSPAEFAASHIPGSVNVPLDTVLERRAELRRQLDTGGDTGGDGEVVLVCRSGQRAARAEQALGPRGVTVLTGGLVGWEAGLQWFSGAIGAGLVVSAATGTCAIAQLSRDR